VDEVRLVSHVDLTETEQTRFAEALERFSSRVWQSERKRPGTRFDLAILVNPKEAMPPRNAGAIQRFIKVDAALKIDAEVIHPSDFIRLGEFDALFIRETTAIDHHTYRFAKKAEAEGMVVIDNSSSILRCTNKVYLARLFATHGVPTPKTLILNDSHRINPGSVIDQLGLPLVVKIPDGSFSRGVFKVDSAEQLETLLGELFLKSSLLLAQEFLYTDYDWRIGVLGGRPIYACRYYIVKNHWQIYQHGASTRAGAFTTMPTFEVPKAVIQAALKATRQIGDSLYGVDVKQSGDQAYVIEVNDNPNIDAGVEDAYLGQELYDLIMEDFARRLEERQRA
jgi:glutathione synthase/RimK-type ligase-like ATP-grasp enzyme